MRHVPLILATLLLATIALSACNRTSGAAAAGDASRRLTVTGSSTVAPLLHEIARRFESGRPGVRVQVQTGGSSRGIRDTRSGAADLGMSSRELTGAEAEELVEHVIAWDAVAFIVHTDNPVTSLTTTQLRGIYTGRIRDWSEVGGERGSIIVSERADGRSEPILVHERLGIDPTLVRADVVDGETQQAIKTVTGNRNAITYGSAGAARYEADRGATLRLLDIEDADPIARPLLLLTRRDASDPLVAALVAYASSADVDDLIEKQAYVPPAR